MNNRNIISKIIVVIILIIFQTRIYSQVSTGVISGIVTEKINELPLPGVNITVEGTLRGSIADSEGHYTISGLEPGRYSLIFSFVSFETIIKRDVEVKNGEASVINAEMAELPVTLGDVVVTAERKTDSEISVINSVRNSPVIVSGISAQMISKSQDRDASEVIKKAPGISVMDDRFLVVRGLSQRYNNVWLNNSATPGTETDSRAFGFDAIPGSQIDNLLIYKSPSPELPADFSGGFVKILTKSRAESNSLSIQYGTSFLEGSTFKAYSLPEGSASNYLGFDNGFRSLPVNFPGNLQNTSVAKSVSFSKVMDNNWSPVTGTIIPDQKISIVYSHDFKGKGKFNAGNFISLGYGISSKRLQSENRRYGIFDATTGESSLYNDFNDTRFSRDVKLAILYNWVFNINDNFKLGFRNLLNQSGQASYTSRTGSESYSGDYEVKSFSDRYYSRMIYSGQIEGIQNIKDENSVINWTVGYASANRLEPDRRIVTSRRNLDFDESSSFGNYRTESNDIRRLFQNLKENTLSGGINYKFRSGKNEHSSEFSAGWYGEFRNRNFTARGFSYETGDSLTAGFYNLPVEEMLSDKYITTDGIYITENTNKSDSYDAANILQAFYGSLQIHAWENMTIYPGLRVEYNRMTLNGFESDGTDPVSVVNEATDFFPSLNLTLKINENNQLRAAYGRSVNRPEFREVAPYVFYDFDAFSNFEGNTGLRNAYINNAEIRYEVYPNSNAIITAGLFYKYFKNPIETTYYETGGSLQYTYTNAESATASGVEAELKSSLSFLGMDDLSMVFNGSWIFSHVQFKNSLVEKDRAMQGQSPYVINAGLFYQSHDNRLSMNVSYNIIGKRIIAVGQVYQNHNEDIPDVYEMPRNNITLSVMKKFGKYLELSATVKDLLNEAARNKQFLNISSEGIDVSKSLITKSYRPGRYFGLSLTVKI